MTCVVGVIGEDGCIVIGADSAACSTQDIRIRKDPKVFRLPIDNPSGEMVIGYTSSFRMGQLLRFNLKIPVRHETDLFAWMVSSFVPAARKCLKDGGYMEVENNKEEGGHFVVGIEGRLFLVEEDMQVGETHDSFVATGCGQDYAMGAFADQECRDTAGSEDLESRALIALRAAERFSAKVGAPFVFEHLNAPK